MRSLQRREGGAGCADIPLLKTIGWKIIPVGLVAITASFLLSTVIAEFALGLWH